jgi:hypothetical protein
MLGLNLRINIWAKLNLIDFFRSKFTEIFLSFYVAIGFLLMIISSKIQIFNNLKIIWENKITIIIILILAILSGLITYLFRRYCQRFTQSFLRNANELSRIDIFSIGYAVFLCLLAGIALLLPPISINFLNISIFLIMVVIVSLNTYFCSFWNQQNINANLELIKMEHDEWIIMFNNACLAFLVGIGGVVFAYFATTKVDNSSSFIKMFLDGFLILQIVFGGPIIWLLRPIHINLNNIRKEKLKTNPEHPHDAPNSNPAGSVTDGILSKGNGIQNNLLKAKNGCKLETLINKVNTEEIQDNSVFIELLKLKCKEGHDMQSIYFKAFIIFTAIIGALVKFSFDANATFELRQAFSVIGLLISFVGIFTVFIARNIRNSITDEIDNLNKKLGSPLISHELLHLKYTEIISFIFVVLIIFGWFYLIIQNHGNITQ